MAHITLIRPPILVPKWSDSGPVTPPIGPAYLAASLRQAGHEAVILDAVGESPFQVTPLYDDAFLAIGLTSAQIVERVLPETNVIGVSCMFSQDWPAIYDLISLLRRKHPSIQIVVGGEHVTAVREFTIESCPEIDYCVLGEGEETLVDLVQSLEQGTPIDQVAGLLYRDEDGRCRASAARPRIADIDSIPRPAWDLVPMEQYLDNNLSFGVDRGRSMPILATRGCPFRCTFCSSPDMWTTRWTARDPRDVLDEIESYMRDYGAVNFDFYDLTAIIKRDWIVEFCGLILEKGLRITWQLPSGTRSEAIDAEVTRLLYESGCRNMTYAPESGSPALLKRVKKKVDLANMQASIRAALRNGINLKLNIIFGLPGETRSELWESMRFVAKMGWIGVHDTSISIFSPYPGSVLYADLRSEGKIPELSTEYFLSLAMYKDFTQCTSYAAGISALEMAISRLFGMALFYAVQYARRPARLYSTVYNFLRNRQESRLDKSLRDLVHRMKPKSQPTPQAPQPEEEQATQGHSSLSLPVLQRKA